MSFFHLLQSHGSAQSSSFSYSRHFLSLAIPTQSGGKFYATADVLANTRSLALSIFGICIFRHRGRRVTVDEGRLPPPQKKGRIGLEVENCNREGVLRGTFPSLPTVCSFRAATPYLQVQCLLSLIHIPWPTRPYYPWLSTGLRTHPSLNLYLPISCLA